MVLEPGTFLWNMTALLLLIAIALLARYRVRPGFDGYDPYIIDGDTLVSDRIRIRLHGMDAPELDQPGGPEARAHLTRLISGGAVRIRPLSTDRYGRMVARVHARAGDLGQLMVRDGYARAAYGDDYSGEERAARRRRAGLWAGQGIISPAAHRAKARSETKPKRKTGWT